MNLRKREITRSSSTDRLGTGSPRMRSPKNQETGHPVPFTVALVQCLIIFVLLASTTVFYFESRTRTDALLNSDNQSRVIEHKFSNCERTYKELLTERDNLNDQLSQAQSNERSAISKYRDAQSESDDLRKQLSKKIESDESNKKTLMNHPILKKQLQKLDLASLRHRYQLKPTKKLRILIEFTQNKVYLPIVIETAPLSIMPHTIRYFVETVESGFWNGCYFFRNAGHVIQANCHRRNQPMNPNPDSITKQYDYPWQTGYSLAFQEYSADYTHQQWTVGIAGRPGGPDFYLSTVDNVRNHGPGGQDDQADPCFARLVRGSDTVRKIHALKTDPNDKMGGMLPEDQVQFKQLTVLTDYSSDWYDVKKDDPFFKENP